MLSHFVFVNRFLFYRRTVVVMSRVVYCVVTDPTPSQCHDKIGMMTARHRYGPCRYCDGGGKWGNFIVSQRRPRLISHGHVS